MYGSSTQFGFSFLLRVLKKGKKPFFVAHSLHFEEVRYFNKEICNIRTRQANCYSERYGGKGGEVPCPLWGEREKETNRTGGRNSEGMVVER